MDFGCFSSERADVYNSTFFRWKRNLRVQGNVENEKLAPDNTFSLTCPDEQQSCTQPAYRST